MKERRKTDLGRGKVCKTCATPGKAEIGRGKIPGFLGNKEDGRSSGVKKLRKENEKGPQ